VSKQDCLELLMLLSALESWSFSVKAPIPDYLIESIEYKVETLKKQILEE
jgi:hypothetical protein